MKLKKFEMACSMIALFKLIWFFFFYNTTDNLYLSQQIVDFFFFFEFLKELEFFEFFLQTVGSRINVILYDFNYIFGKKNLRNNC